MSGWMSRLREVRPTRTTSTAAVRRPAPRPTEADRWTPGRRTSPGRSRPPRPRPLPVGAPPRRPRRRVAVGGPGSLGTRVGDGAAGRPRGPGRSTADRPRRRAGGEVVAAGLAEQGVRRVGRLAVGARRRRVHRLRVGHRRGGRGVRRSGRLRSATGRDGQPADVAVVVRRRVVAGRTGARSRRLLADPRGLRRGGVERHLVGLVHRPLQPHGAFLLALDVDDLAAASLVASSLPVSAASCTARPSLVVAVASSPAAFAARPSWITAASSVWPV